MRGCGLLDLHGWAEQIRAIACASRDPTPGWGTALVMCGVATWKVTIAQARAHRFSVPVLPASFAAIRFAGSAVRSPSKKRSPMSLLQDCD